jgi:hypothetical protein
MSNARPRAADRNSAINEYRNAFFRMKIIDSRLKMSVIVMQRLRQARRKRAPG